MSQRSRDGRQITESKKLREAKAQPLEKPAWGSARRVRARGGGWALETLGTVCPGYFLLETLS